MLRSRFCLTGLLVLLFSLIAVESVLGQTTEVFTADGDFTVPAGVSNITVEVWGGGGGGARAGGGGAGGYARSVLPITSGTVLPFTVGAGGAEDAAGGTTAFDGGVVAASGGQAGGVTAGGAGGSGTAGEISFTGGTGGTGSDSNQQFPSGGGGGSPTENGDGGDANGFTAGTGEGNGGAGGADRNTEGGPGVVPGGGGGGSAGPGGSAAGAGAGGQVRITYQVASAGNSAVAAAPLSVEANGVASTMLTLEVADSDGVGIAGLLEGDFTFNGTGSADASGFSETGPAGTYTIAFTNETVENLSIQVEVGLVDLGTTAEISFVAPEASAGNSTVVADPLSVLANGVASTTLTLEVADSDGVAITGLQASDFTFNGTGSADGSGFSETGPAGTYTIAFTNETVEDLQIQVEVGSVDLGTTAQISFISPTYTIRGTIVDGGGGLENV
ncbi:MAG: invasin domain 3-containing protein, partial [Balneolales bacterium]